MTAWAHYPAGVQHRQRRPRGPQALTLAVLVAACGLAAAVRAESGPPSALAIEVPPELCSGYGSVDSISFTDWESGLGSWTVGTRNVANESTFLTPDWAVVGSLPDSRAGKGAFVANLNIGDCAEDNEAGVLFLTSPPFQLPADAQVPRLAFQHWFATEAGSDGGNLKVSVNGGEFLLVPAQAIEFNTYTGTLLTVTKDYSNPLEGQPAWTGTGAGSTGAWAEVWVNLLGLAQGGDTVEFRFDFGIDGCFGEQGWYVDDIRVYRCSDELPPSDCGNGIPDPGEQCDDGNDYIGDGCSNTCQVEAGWECTAAVKPGEVGDPGFEQGTPNPEWAESSTNFGSPICDLPTCGTGPGSGPANGSYWAWFGGAKSYEKASLEQPVTIPAGATNLTFQLEAAICDSGSDYLEVSIDDNVVFRIDGTSPSCGAKGYVLRSADISGFADGDVHSLSFLAETFAANADVTNFFVDDVAIPGALSICSPELPLFQDGFESK